jgi:hypothetical protein
MSDLIEALEEQEGRLVFDRFYDADGCRLVALDPVEEAVLPASGDPG